MRTSVNKRNNVSSWHMTNTISYAYDCAFINQVGSIGCITPREV